MDCQTQVGQAYRDKDRWTHMSILNAVRMGHFSSDRSIHEYCQNIWKVSPVPISERVVSNQLTCRLNQAD